MANTKRIPTYTTDDHGNDIVLITLANYPTPARIFREDFEALRAAGWSDQWNFNDSGNGYGYVKVPNSDPISQHDIVARLILKPGKRRQVKYRNGDRTDLTRSNLYLAQDSRGKKGRTSAATLAGKVERFKAAVARMV